MASPYDNIERDLLSSVSHYHFLIPRKLLESNIEKDTKLNNKLN